MSLALVPVQTSETPIDLWVQAEELPDTPGTDEDRATAARIATDVLYALSGRQWPGVRTSELLVAPTVRGGPELLPTSMPWGGRLSRGCGCCASELDPRVYPIVEVIELLVGDVSIPADQIDYSNGRTIRVTRGSSTVDPLAVNRWCGPDGFYSLFPSPGGCGSPSVRVTLDWGRAVPAAGAAAALAFAKELVKALTGDQSCRLPGNVVNVSRQGVSVLIDPSTFLDKGRTGIPLADLWLTAVNPKRLQSEAWFWDPAAPLPETVG